jgi:hypothetical protein
MTAEATPTQSGGKIDIKGKHFETLRRFAEEFVWDEKFPFVAGKTRQEVIELICSLHPDHIAEEDARAFLMCESYRFSRIANDNGERCPDASEQPYLRAQFAEHLKAEIAALPHRYKVRIELPSFPTLVQAKLPLSNSVSLRVDSHWFNQLTNEPSTSMVSLAALARGLSAAPLKAFIEIELIGFCDGSTESTAAARCISTAKQCAFLLTATGAAQDSWSDKTATANFDPSPYGLSNAAFQLPHSLGRCFGRLVPNESAWEVPDEAVGRPRTLLGGAMRPPKTEEERIAALSNSLWQVSRFLNCSGHTEFTSIAAAVEWHQDSRWADNQTFSYLAACIGLEAILGSDGYMDGMSRRLADRYAFLVGRGRSERDALSKRYEAVLNLRGRLVHAKAARLKPNDEGLLREAQAMLSGVIWHEMHEMYRIIDREKSKSVQSG